MSVLVERAIARVDAFLNRFQGQAPNTRVTYLKNEPQKHPTPALFGADPNSGDFEDWASYRTPKLNGPGAQPLQTEMKEYDSDVDKWKGPNPNLPAMVSHGRHLDYESVTDQKPISKGTLTPSDVWDGIVRNKSDKKDFQSSRSHEKTEGDRQAEDLRHYSYNFTI